MSMLPLRQGPRVKPSQVAGFSEPPSAKPSLKNVTLSSRDQKSPMSISEHLQAWDSPASDSYPALLLTKKSSKQQITLFQKWHFYKYPRQMFHLFCSSAAVSSILCKRAEMSAPEISNGASGPTSFGHVPPTSQFTWIWVLVLGLILMNCHKRCELFYSTMPTSLF